ncbi:hypothetical protein ACO0QE_000510 [Hanseniaspora vineae]
MENIDIQSKAFVIKWIKLFPSKYTDESNAPFIKISWQLKPLKKNIEFGIYKKQSPGTSNNAPITPITPITPVTPHAKISSDSSIYEVNTNTHNHSHTNHGSLNQRLKVNGLIGLKKYKNNIKHDQIFEDSIVITNPNASNGNNVASTSNCQIEPFYVAFVLNNEHNIKKNRVLFSSTITPLNNCTNDSVINCNQSGLSNNLACANTETKRVNPDTSSNDIRKQTNQTGSAMSLVANAVENSAIGKPRSSSNGSNMSSTNISSGNSTSSGNSSITSVSSPTKTSPPTRASTDPSLSSRLNKQQKPANLNLSSQRKSQTFAYKPTSSSSLNPSINRSRSMSMVSNNSTSSTTNGLSHNNNNNNNNTFQPYYTHNGRFFQGYLLKKRRKKLQGFSKRFFKIDYREGKLSYYLNETSQGVSRGEVIIKLCVISADKSKKMIILDSGLELWYMKAQNYNDWKIWCEALSTKAIASYANLHKPNPGESRNALQDTKSATTTTDTAPHSTNTANTAAENLGSIINKQAIPSQQHLNSEGLALQQHQDMASLLAKMDTLDATVHNLAQTNDEKRKHSVLLEFRELSHDIKKGISKYMKSENHKSTSSNMFSCTTKNKTAATKSSSHDNLLKKITSSSHLHPAEDEAQSVLSMEYFDAADEIPGVILIDDEMDQAETPLLANPAQLGKETSPPISTSNTSKSTAKASAIENDLPLEVDNKNMWPLHETTSTKHTPVKRRNDVPESKTQPPTLLSFLRKNVGKDLSTVSMPVTSNEPITILQYMAETFEYAPLLNKCFPDVSNLNGTDSAQAKLQRLALVTAFAISNLSLQRNKTRCTRKPFSPLLAETYELCRDDLGFRFIAEKVEHKPQQVFALHVDSVFNWEVDYTLVPSQKFWGKSIELNNIGVFTLKFVNRASGKILETYQWSAPTTVLKNIIAGERFVEPMGLFEVHCLETGYKSSCEFKSTGGFFKGRSEDVNCNLYEAVGSSLTSAAAAKRQPEAKKTKISYKKAGEIQGTWTKKLVLMPANTVLWECGALVPNADKKYGFTKFSADLNEITSMERNFIPPTDSRLRPDLQSYEKGQIDRAEELKLKLEQEQRERRNNKKDIVPHFFTKVGKQSLGHHGDNSSNGSSDDLSAVDQWEYVAGVKSYWNRRKLQYWDDIEPLW